MHIIIDSGSTKADWAIVHSSGITECQTPGMNPTRHKHLYDLSQLPQDILQKISKAEKLSFYGAGINGENTIHRIRDHFSPFVPRDCHIEVQSDMLGAARATSGRDPGIVCILGTGSNSCLYDGDKIIDQIPTLGFIISDEGGATTIGKELLRAYYYDEMPNSIKTIFEEEYDLNIENVTKNLYQGNTPGKYLANFAKILEKADHGYCEKLLEPIFRKFIDLRIKRYNDFSQYNLHFIGSIAYFYSKILNKVLQRDGLKIASSTRKPVIGLVKYHTGKEWKINV